MKTIEINGNTTAVVTQMREGDAFGAGRVLPLQRADGTYPEDVTDFDDGNVIVEDAELRDGNMIPRLCKLAGQAACASECQLKRSLIESPGKLCAEDNILSALSELGVAPENFAMVSATEDRVGFADDLESLGASEHSNGFTMVPKCNAFFFRPTKDTVFGGSEPLTHAAMRMADCGDVIYTFKDSEGEDVLGIAHFSRTNMHGPSAYTHDRNGKKVSWGEYVLGSALEHYGADSGAVDVTLVAAVNRDDFVHHFTDATKMEKTFPGWNELGFMHPRADEDFDCDVDYREMIRWQLESSIQDESLRLNAQQIDTSKVINTGDLSLGHASHRAAQKGLAEHGRDMYIVGLNG